MNFLVFAEHRNGTFKKSTFEAVHAASRLASEKGGTVTALVIGASMAEGAAALGGYGANKAVVVTGKNVDAYATGAYARAAAETAASEGANIVFLAATAMGKDIAPRLAAKLDGV